jgi:hypothetical protein
MDDIFEEVPVLPCGLIDPNAPADKGGFDILPPPEDIVLEPFFF